MDIKIKGLTDVEVEASRLKNGTNELATAKAQLDVVDEEAKATRNSK